MSVPELIALLDAIVRTGFQSLRDAYFFKLEVCTFAVVVGVFIEESEYFLSWPRVRRKLPLAVLLPIQRFDTWVRRISKVGWILILLGVGGEFWYEARVSRADGWLQEFNGILSAAQETEIKELGDITSKARSDAKAASYEADKAKAESANAKRVAGESESLALGARQEADSFEKRIVSATDTAAKAESHLAEALREATEANRKLENEIQARVKLEEVLSGWKLNPDAQERLTVKLAPFKGTPYTLNVNPSEAVVMQALDAALTNAGWYRQHPKNPDGKPSGILFGDKATINADAGFRVLISREAQERFIKAVAALKDGLGAEGIPARAEMVMIGLDPSAIVIIIGKRE